MPKTVLVRIEGRVQGVGYRDWMVERASHLGLFGWVRNRKDGTVEALLHGAAGGVDLLVELCEDGPPSALVRSVTCTPVDDERDDIPDDFIRRT